MAYYDAFEAAHKRDNAEKYEQLKRFISSKDESGKLSDWFPAFDHIRDMEKSLKEQDEKIKEYKSFFSLLKSLMPKGFSMSDRIG